MNFKKSYINKKLRENENVLLSYLSRAQKAINKEDSNIQS